MFGPDENNNNGFLDNINKLAGTGLNIVSLINGIRGIGTDNPYYYQPNQFNMQMPQGMRFPQQQNVPQQFPQGNQMSQGGQLTSLLQPQQQFPNSFGNRRFI